MPTEKRYVVMANSGEYDYSYIRPVMVSDSPEAAQAVVDMKEKDEKLYRDKAYRIIAEFTDDRGLLSDTRISRLLEIENSLTEDTTYYYIVECPHIDV